MSWSRATTRADRRSLRVELEFEVSRRAIRLLRQLVPTVAVALVACGGGSPGQASNSQAQTPVASVTAATAPVTGAAFPLRVSTDQRHLVDQHDRPFLVVGDTAWSLMTAVTKADAEIYLEDRRRRGFNAIVVNLVEHHFKGPANREGALPFLKKRGVYDFSKPVEAYFAHVDHVLGLARDKGMLVMLAPAYLGYRGGSEGWWPEINTSVNGEAVMENYGRWLGARYRGMDNIVWLVGGDWYGQESLPKTQALVRGLQSADRPERLITAHNARNESGYLYYGSEAWFTVNTTYSDCTLTPRRSIEDYRRSRVMPFVFIEGRYEGENTTAQVCLRSQAYWPVLLGAAGSFFGNRPIWLFDPGWQTALASQGALNMTNFSRLFRSRAWERLVPDLDGSVLVDGRGTSGVDYAAAARTSDGSSIIVYAPSHRALTIDMTKMSEPLARAWWFNPSHGTATLIGEAPTRGVRSFTPPGPGDWVLVIDNASLALAAPGQ